MITNDQRLEILEALVRDGVQIPCFDGIIIEPTVKIKKSTLILPNTIILGSTTIEEACVIGPGSYLVDTLVDSSTRLNNVHSVEATIGKNVTAGPFVHIRPNTKIMNNVHIGNFVEVKNSVVDENTKLPHLLYIGDSDIGKDVNFGCGCVTVNYDGRNKSRTIVKDGAFIGCNTNLVAPVTVGENAFTAAGSTITEDVPDNALAIARSKQSVKNDWVSIKKPYKRQHLK